MARKRIRIDIENNGAKYDIKLEGNVTRESILKIFEVMGVVDIEEQEASNMGTLGSKIWHIVDRHFPTGKFTSADILEKYEDEFNEPVKLAKISTYLARFTDKNRIDRIRTGRKWTYQAARMGQRQA